MVLKGILAHRERLYIPLYIFLLISVSLHSFLGFEYLTPLALLSPLFFFDIKELGFSNYRRGFIWGLPFLIPILFLFPSYGDIRLVADHVGIALAEELFFRGFMMRRYSNLQVSFMFSLPHIILYPSLGAVLTFIPSLLFGYVYKKSGSVIAPVFVHFSANISYFGLVERFEFMHFPWDIGI